jgi:hypothetical protein
LISYPLSESHTVCRLFYAPPPCMPRQDCLVRGDRDTITRVYAGFDTAAIFRCCVFWERLFPRDGRVDVQKVMNIMPTLRSRCR